MAAMKNPKAKTKANGEARGKSYKFAGETNTMRGDIRDWMLGVLRGMDKPFAKLTENQQSDLIDRIDDEARHVVRGAFNAVVSKEMLMLEATVKGINVTGGLKITLEASRTDSNLVAVLSIPPSGVVRLLTTQAGSLMGEREPAEADPDEPPLFDETNAGKAVSAESAPA